MNQEEIKKSVAFFKEHMVSLSNIRNELKKQSEEILILSAQASNEMSRIQSLCKHEWPKEEGLGLMGRGNCTVCGMSDC